MAECKRTTQNVATFMLKLSDDEACAVWRVLQRVRGAMNGPRGLTEHVSNCIEHAMPGAASIEDLSAMFVCTGVVELDGARTPE